jgi:hypothetical protein
MSRHEALRRLFRCGIAPRLTEERHRVTRAIQGTLLRLSGRDRYVDVYKTWWSEVADKPDRVF